MQDIYKTFEFNKIQEKLLEYSKTELGKVYINELVMLDDADDVKNSLSFLSEVSSLLMRYGPLPISSSANAIKLIEIAKKTALLTPRDLYLLSDDIETINKINVYLKKVDSSYPLVLSLSNEFYDLSSLFNKIRAMINSSLTVVDSATPELNRIRHELKVKEAKLLSLTSTLAIKYGDCLSDSGDTIRDGHFVLPVKTSYKNKILGVIYDVSSTGNTTFIEPLEVVQLNNEITQLKVQENEEVRKVLKELTSLVLLQENEVLTNNKLIAKLDFNIAKALYGKEINGVIASFSDKQFVDIKKGRHPLLDAKKVIANDYHLDEDKRIVVISGPNAGGKTVTLKTVGIIVLMNQCGLMVPANKATLGYFKHIYLDIGDNQSLSDNLSTFSAHMSQIAEIANLAKGKDLILLDELGTGTDPKEGEAIAISVTKHLENKHSLCMISSHFDALKEYAFLSNNVINSSMIFDEEHLVPTYIFSLGIPGKSYALDVARRFGLEENLIKEAKEYLKQDKSNDATTLINELQKKMRDITLIEQENIKASKEIESVKKELEIEKASLKERKANLLKDAKNEKEEMIEKAQDEIDQIMKSLSSDIKLHEAIEIKNKLDELKEKEEDHIFNEEINVNDYVLYPKLNIVGKVVAIKNNQVTISSNDGFTYKVEKALLTKIDKPQESARPHKSNIDNSLKTNVGLELNIIGLRREEAKDKVIKYIDDCRIKHFKTVRIIHGFGSGILRTMVHEYLSSQKDLTFRLGDGFEGGSGATMVTFK